MFALLASLGIFCFVKWHSPTALFPRDTILQTAPLSPLVSRRYVLFTTPIDTGEWPQLCDTKGKFIAATNETSHRVPSQIYSGLPRSIGQHLGAKSGLDGRQFVFAMATDSMHVMADDFMPLWYLNNTGITLLVVLGPMDPAGPTTVQKHLDTLVGIKAFVIQVPQDDKAMLKFELLSVLKEFKKYEQGEAHYYTILDDDVFASSVSTFQSLVGQYNSIESHLIVDMAARKDVTSKSPIVLTNALLDRIFASDATWQRCYDGSKTMTTGVSKILKCVALTQGQETAKLDEESLMLRQVSGNAIGLLESGHQPLFYAPYETSVAGDVDGDLFVRLLTNRITGLPTSSLFGRYTFSEDDEIRWVYTHGLSMVQYPRGITERQLKQTEVTWTRTREEVPAHDAPYYRAEISATDKVAYHLTRAEANIGLSKRKDGGKKPLEWTSLLYSDPGNSNAVQIDWVTSL